jgi:triacylglycerol esterase/lipase EstA (alpha/beta hydrolase family)
MLSGGLAQADDCVVLLHGLMRGPASMSKMQTELDEAGFFAVNIEYPSRDHSIEELADMAVPDGLVACREHDGIERIHFVTHSLGGILVRQFLSTNDIPELGRVVMLGPPNQGSLAADEMVNVPGFDWINGPAGKQLGKGEESVPLKLGPSDF